jgi:hypothetical protein
MFTYTGDHSDPLQRTRFLLGDTNSAAALLQDEQISTMLAEFDFNEAVAQMARGLASQAAQDPDSYEADGGLKITFSKKIENWHNLAHDMRAVARAADVSVPRSGIAAGRIRDPEVRRMRF